jgi:hypothetical protein
VFDATMPPQPSAAEDSVLEGHVHDRRTKPPTRISILAPLSRAFSVGGLNAPSHDSRSAVNLGDSAQIILLAPNPMLAVGHTLALAAVVTTFQLYLMLMAGHGIEGVPSAWSVVATGSADAGSSSGMAPQPTT